MPKRRPPDKFKLPFKNLTTETPDAELYAPEANFLARFEREGWLRLDVNLQTSLTVSKLLREIGVKRLGPYADASLVGREGELVEETTKLHASKRTLAARAWVDFPEPSPPSKVMNLPTAMSPPG